MWIVLCWQEVVRVPLIVVAPGVPGGQVVPCCCIIVIVFLFTLQVVSHLVSLVDLFPR